jgi:16S rRNA processing protein RimM
LPDRVLVGRVGRPHGLGGAFVVEDASEDPERFATGSTLFVGDEEAEIVESKVAGGRPVIRLDRGALRGAPLEVDRSALPDPGPDSYYVRDLVGLEVVEDDGEALGRVVEVEAGVANDVLELDSGLSVPLVDACVRRIDLEGRRILVEPGYIPRG